MTSMKTAALFVCLVLPFFASLTFGCSCLPFTASPSFEEFNKTDYLFIGRVTNIRVTRPKDAPDAVRIATFRVTELIKSPSNTTNSTLLVYSPKSSSLCGRTIKLNERWQIWGHFGEFFLSNNGGDKISVNLCDRSTTDTRANIKQLRRWARNETL